MNKNLVKMLPIRQWQDILYTRTRVNGVGTYKHTRIHRYYSVATNKPENCDAISCQIDVKFQRKKLCILRNA